MLGVVILKLARALFSGARCLKLEPEEDPFARIHEFFRSGQVVGADLRYSGIKPAQ
jgi:hypothetical protein